MNLRSMLRRATDVSPFLNLPPGVRTRAKYGLARTLDTSGLTRLGHHAQRRLLSPFIRVINLHDVPPSLASRFEAQLQFYRAHFVAVGIDELRALLAGQWRSGRPGLILTFDDGLGSHARVAAPLLETYGFRGWFFVPPGFVDCPPGGQRAHADAHRINYSRAPGEDMGAMTWDELRALRTRGHVIGCHSYSHVRLSSELTDAELDREIVASRHRLETQLDHPVTSFCWVGGEDSSYSARAAHAIRDAGYELGFMNAKGVVTAGTHRLHLHRICVEAGHPLWFVRYLLSGAVDLMYARKRERINQLCAGRASHA